MGGWGMTFIILGLGSFVLKYFHFEFALLMWVDNWGPTIGTMIRLGFVALGILIMVAPKFIATKE
jgi:hypothetical protein